MAVKKKITITDVKSVNAHDQGYKEQQVPLWKFWGRRRYVLMMMSFFGFFNVYAMRVNLSIAIVDMTENKTVMFDNGTTVQMPEFDWDSKQQGFMLSAFFYGYITSQIVGGLLAARIGGTNVFGVGVAVTSVMTLLTPIVATTDFYLLAALRIIEGAFEGVSYPCIHEIWSKWSPPLERSRLSTITYSGGFAGTVVSMPLCAYLAATLGWPSIFYFFGSLGVVWSIAWFLMVSRSPDRDKYITQDELQYIQSSMENVGTDEGFNYPWRSFFTSVPFWAIVAAHFSETWGFYTLVTQLPKFMKEALGFNLTKTGLMSALPYLAKSITIQISGYLADLLQIKKILTTTQVRKWFTCLAYVGECIFWVTAAYWLHPIGSPICLACGVGIGAFAWAGFCVNYLDIAPQYAGILMGIGNTIGTLPGVLSPLVTGYLVTTPTPNEWRMVFFIASGIYLVGCIIYGIFASGELQPWAMNTRKESDQKAKDKMAEAHENKVFVPDA